MQGRSQILIGRQGSADLVTTPISSSQFRPTGRRRPGACARQQIGGNDGGIDGRHPLTGQSPTATAEPIDNVTSAHRSSEKWPGVQNAAKPLRQSRFKLRRSHWDAEYGVPREGWNPVP